MHPHRPALQIGEIRFEFAPCALFNWPAFHLSWGVSCAREKRVHWRSGGRTDGMALRAPIIELSRSTLNLHAQFFVLHSSPFKALHCPSFFKPQWPDPNPPITTDLPHRKQGWMWQTPFLPSPSSSFQFPERLPEMMFKAREQRHLTEVLLSSGIFT